MKNNLKIDYSDKSLYKHSILSTVYKVLGMGLSLISAPLLIAYLGDEKYGIYASLLSIVSWIYYMDLGIGNGLRNRLAEAIAEDRINQIKKYLCVSYTIMAGVALMVIAVIVVLFQFIDLEAALNIVLPSEDVNWLMIVAFSLACINFVMSLMNNILFAIQQASLVNLLGLVAQVVNICCLFFLRYVNTTLILYVVLAEGIANLIKNIAGTAYVFRRYEDLRFSLKDLDFSYAKGILSLGIKMFISSISALILNATDNLIITKYIGAAEVTPYSFCYKYFNILNSFMLIFLSPMHSAYTVAYTRNEVHRLKELLKKNMILFLVVGAGTVAAAFIFEPFAKIWLQKELEYKDGLVLLVCLYFLMLMFSHVFSSFLGGIGRVNAYTVATIVQAIVNIPVSIYCAVNLQMGVNGVILGSVVSVAISDIVMPASAIYELRKISGGNRK